MKKTVMGKISLSLGLAAFTVVNAQGSAQAKTQYNPLETVNPTLATVELNKASKPIAKITVSPSVENFQQHPQEIQFSNKFDRSQNKKKFIKASLRIFPKTNRKKVF